MFHMSLDVVEIGFDAVIETEDWSILLQKNTSCMSKWSFSFNIGFHCMSNLWACSV